MPSISSSVSYPITKDKGGTGLITSVVVGAQIVQPNAILIGGPLANSYISQLTLNDGQLLIGSTSNPPVPATLTAGAGISITNGAGTITVATTGTVPVTSGGTGLTSVTTNALLVGAGTSALTVLASVNNAFLVTDGTGVPSFSTTLPATQLNSITSLPNLATVGTITTGVWNGTTIAVGFGGTGATTLTTNGVLLGNGSGAITATAAMTDGQLLIGSTGNPPVPAALIGSGGITITPGAGTITISGSGGSTPSITPYIVGPATTGAQYTTISAAVTAAAATSPSPTNQANIYILPKSGSYIEDVVLQDGINLIGFSQSFSTQPISGIPATTYTPSVVINGLVTAVGQNIIDGIKIANSSSPGNASVRIGNGTSVSTLYLNQCVINTGSSGAIFSIGTPNGSTLSINSCDVGQVNSGRLFSDVSPASLSSFKLLVSRSIINDLPVETTFTSSNFLIEALIEYSSVYIAFILTTGAPFLDLVIQNSTIFLNAFKLINKISGTGVLTILNSYIRATTSENIAVATSLAVLKCVSDGIFTYTANTALIDYFSLTSESVYTSNIPVASSLYTKQKSNSGISSVQVATITTTNQTGTIVKGILVGSRSANCIACEFVAVCKTDAAGTVTFPANGVVFGKNDFTGATVTVAGFTSGANNFQVLASVDDASSYSWACTYNYQSSAF